MKDKSIIVIGGGIIGLCSAYYLNKKGYKVTVLDDTDGSNNCSYGNAGFFCPSHIIPLASPGKISQGLRWMLKQDSPFYIKPKMSWDLVSWGLKFKKAATNKRVNSVSPMMNKLLLESRSLIEQILTDEHIDAGFNDEGLVVYCRTQHVLDETIAMAELAKEYGQEVVILSKDEAKTVNPDLDLDVIGAVHFKNDAFVTPHLLMDALKTVLIDKGVDVQFNKKVTQLVPSYSGAIDKIIINEKESVQADQYVVAVGSWSKELLKPLGVNLPMQAGKGYSFVLPNPKVNLRTCAILEEASVAVTPMTHGLRFAGTLEINGMDLSINKKRVQGIINAICDYFPQFTAVDFENLDIWTGLRPCTPDGLPYIGRTRQYNNLIVAAGHAMLGVALAPVTGRLIAQIASDEKVDLSFIDVNRYN